MNYEEFNHGNKKIFLVDMQKENNKIFSELVIKGLDKYINQKKNVAIIVNKKGYSNGQICQDCGYVPKCEKCDISIAYHKNSGGDFYGICHICKKQYNHNVICPNCGGFEIKNYGFGLEKIKEYIKVQYNVDPIIIESLTVNSQNKIQNRKKQLNKGNVVIGTSILTTPINDIDFDLLIFINADIGLNIPDYQSNYKNFLFLYETINNYNTKNIIVQSFKVDNQCIRHACKLDLDGFKNKELEYRKKFGYPPYSKLSLILYKNEVEERVFNTINKLYQELLYLKEINKEKFSDIEIYPTPPLIYKIYGKYRYNIIIKGKSTENFITKAFEDLKLSQRGFKIDPSPESLL